MTTTVILAAGEGRRFRDQGYLTPKALLPANGETMITRIARALPDRLLVVIQWTQRMEFFRTLGKSRAKYILLDRYTSGPLASLRHGLKAVDMESDLLVSYCDTLIDGQDVRRFLDEVRPSGLPCGMVVFRSEEKRFGYADVDRSMGINRVVEKRVVSPWAAGGLFWFRTGAEFRERIERIINPVAGVPALMTGGLAVALPEGSVVDLGTPEAYHAYLRDQPQGVRVSIDLIPEHA